MAQYRLLAPSCDDGPCPTFYVEPSTRDVKVQGYRTTPPGPIPDGEDVVLIDAEAWTLLLSRLPLRMLLRALGDKLRGRSPQVHAAPTPVAR